MRKPRDFDAELKTLSDKAQQLKDQKVRQLGELVIATGADALTIEQLAGLLLAGTENKDASAKESWRKRGSALFHRTAKAGGGTDNDTRSNPASEGGALPATSANRA
ncbi:conjugal transfer protein TraD [Sphingomonas sp. PAMC 26617]|uniref:conjugal transfer protein TraD n=1 Tax=Sphingomonas sp. PAMC 26617 TaxID=1112216 RepID=UPI000289D13D|nr:conjugal transfer protein TraD [Sphingomonas sp. PAMC 26617]